MSSGQPGHMAIGLEDFAQDAGGLEAGEPGEIDAGFGMARAAQNAAIPGAQREDVAGLDEIVRRGLGVHEELDGARAVRGADAGGHAFGGVHGYGEIRAITFPIFQDHALQAELGGAFFGDGRANQAATVGGHEIHGGGGYFLGGHYQIALVFAVSVVRDDDHAAGADFLDGVFDGIKLRVVRHDSEMADSR